MSTKNEQTQGIDVAYVAHLARLYLSDGEIAEFQGQMEQILKYVDELKALDVLGIEPTAHAVPVHNVFREDVVKPSLDRDQVLNNAPDHRNDQFVVPKIIE